MVKLSHRLSCDASSRFAERSACLATGEVSAFAQQFVDPALKLPLLDLAAAQSLVEVTDGGVGRHHAKGEPNFVGLAPDQPGQERTAFARNGQGNLLRQFCGRIELDAGAVFADIADDAVHGGATLVEPGDTAEKHLVARTLAPILHWISSTILPGPYPP